MARRWTQSEEQQYKSELEELYVTQNLSLGEIAKKLNLHESSVHKRMLRLGISRTPELKKGYLNLKRNFVLPKRSGLLAEFIGIMLGDGHIAPYQTIVTLGTKEEQYVQVVMEDLFKTAVTIHRKGKRYSDVCLSSSRVASWLKSEGLVSNKVKAQVGVPDWIYSETEYMKALIRGFFDTDGSVYKLKFGVQLSFTNYSLPLLLALQNMLRKLGYRVSEVSSGHIYVTRREDVERFFTEIQPRNVKHQLRYQNLTRR